MKSCGSGSLRFCLAQPLPPPPRYWADILRVWSLGPWVVGRFAGRSTRPLRVYAWLELSIGLGALLVGPLLSGFGRAYPLLFASLSGFPGLFVAARMAVAFAAVLIPTFCMGGTRQVLGQLVDRGRQQWGITVGWLYVLNTFGAGLGALAVPFVLLPQLGLSKTVWGCTAVNGLLSIDAWPLTDFSNGGWPSPAFDHCAEKQAR